MTHTNVPVITATPLLFFRQDNGIHSPKIAEHVSFDQSFLVKRGYAYISFGL